MLFLLIHKHALLIRMVELASLAKLQAWLNYRCRC